MVASTASLIGVGMTCTVRPHSGQTPIWTPLLMSPSFSVEKVPVVDHGLDAAAVILGLPERFIHAPLALQAFDEPSRPIVAAVRECHHWVIAALCAWFDTWLLVEGVDGLCCPLFASTFDGHCGLLSLLALITIHLLENNTPKKRKGGTPRTCRPIMYALATCVVSSPGTCAHNEAAALSSPNAYPPETA